MTALDNIRLRFWDDMFLSGTSIEPSILHCAAALLLFALAYFLFAQVRFGEPVFSPVNVLKGLIPYEGFKMRNEREVSGIWKLLLSLVISLQVFSKLSLFSVAPRATSFINLIVVLNWLVGLYFLAGWGWVLTQCPPWEESCL